MKVLVKPSYKKAEAPNRMLLLEKGGNDEKRLQQSYNKFKSKMCADGIKYKF